MGCKQRLRQAWPNRRSVCRVLDQSALRKEASLPKVGPGDGEDAIWLNRTKGLLNRCPEYFLHLEETRQETKKKLLKEVF